MYGRMQLHVSLRQAMRAVIKREGVRGLYRGATAMALGAGPAHAIYFATYERAKDVYGGNRQGYQFSATAAAGLLFDNWSSMLEPRLLLVYVYIDMLSFLQFTRRHSNNCERRLHDAMGCDKAEDADIAQSFQEYP